MISSRMLLGQITSSLRAPAELSSLHSSDCSLLVLSFRSSPFRISNLEPLFAKHPGGGVRVCVATGLDASPILPGEEERRMANFLEYNPEQAYLLPPTVREVLGGGHLCFFVHGAVEKLDLRELEAGYSEEGHPAYHPALLLKVWLYAYALGMTSSRRLEQSLREDLAFR